MYSVKLKGIEQAIKRAKGISKYVVGQMDHNDYRKVLENQKDSSLQMTVLRSKRHNVTTHTFTKRGLSVWEDKRCWMDVNVSLPHGHYATGVPPPAKRPRVQIPMSGDVLSDSLVWSYMRLCCLNLCAHETLVYELMYYDEIWFWTDVFLTINCDFATCRFSFHYRRVMKNNSSSILTLIFYMNRGTASLHKIVTHISSCFTVSSLGQVCKGLSLNISSCQFCWLIYGDV